MTHPAPVQATPPHRSPDDARSLLYGHIEDALAAGLTLDDVRQVAQEAHSSLLADRSFAKDEQERDLYPHLAKGDSCTEALEAAERALADAEKIILGQGSIAWVGSLILEGVRIYLRENRWPDSQECANAYAERQQREHERTLS